MSEEYGLTSPPRHIQLVKRSTVPERQNSSRKAYCRERKSSGEIAAVSNRGAQSHDADANKFEQKRLQSNLRECYSPKPTPNTKENSGNQAANKKAVVRKRPVSGVSSCDDSEIREFKQKVRQNREMLKKQREDASLSARNPDYFCKSQSQKLKVLVSRQVAKIKRELSLGSGYGSNRKLTPWVIASNNQRAKKQFRDQMYGKLSEYIHKKNNWSKMEVPVPLSENPTETPRKVCSERELACRPNIPQRKTEKPSAQTAIRSSRLVYPFPGRSSIEQPKEPQPPKQPVAKQLQTKPLEVVRADTGINYLDFKSEFDRFNKGMLRTQRYMQELVQNSLVLVELQTEVLPASFRSDTDHCLRSGTASCCLVSLVSLKPQNNDSIYLMYTISAFPNRECFMALALSLFDKPRQGLAELEVCLRRCRNPPISAVYTYELLMEKPMASYALDVVRFVSQLADLSKGSSISESVGILKEGSLLSQVRHSLTHKHMVGDPAISRARNLILQELREGYWRKIYDQMVAEGIYSRQLLEEEHLRIFKQELKLPVQQLSIANPDRLQAMNNYQFTTEISDFLQKITDPTELRQFAEKLTELKKGVVLSKLLTNYSNGLHNQTLELILALLLPMPVMKEQSLLEPYLLRKLQKLRFFDFVEGNVKLLQALPSNIRQHVELPFQKAKEAGVSVFAPALS